MRPLLSIFGSLVAVNYVASRTAMVAIIGDIGEHRKRRVVLYLGLGGLHS